MRKNCRTIVMAYVNLQSGRIEFLAKSQPSNTDKKQTAEFLFISPEERVQFGLHSIEYFLNYYEDDVAYVWPNYYAHIASFRQREETLKQILINELSFRVDADLTRVQAKLHLCDLRAMLLKDNRETLEQVEEPETQDSAPFQMNRYEVVYLFMRPLEKQIQLCRIEQPWPLLDRNLFQIRFQRKLSKIQTFIPDNPSSSEVYFTSSFFLHRESLLSYFLDEILAANERGQTKHKAQLQWLQQIYSTIRENCT